MSWVHCFFSKVKIVILVSSFLSYQQKKISAGLKEKMADLRQKKRC